MSLRIAYPPGKRAVDRLRDKLGQKRMFSSPWNRALLLALVSVFLGLAWPKTIVSFMKQALAFSPEDDTGCYEPSRGDRDSSWQLIENSGGFRTFVSKVPGSGLLTLRGETVVDEHVGRLYTAFLNTTSTLDWVRFLVEVEELPVAGKRGAGRGGDGGVIFQRYDMPWPVKDREVVLRRSLRLDKRSKKVIATYKSTEHPARPVTATAVRALVHRTSWMLTSLGGSRTAIEFETRTDPKGSLPAAIVGFMQKKFPRDTVSKFVDYARGLSIHSSMAKW